MTPPGKQRGKGRFWGGLTLVGILSACILPLCKAAPRSSTNTPTVQATTLTAQSPQITWKVRHPETVDAEVQAFRQQAEAIQDSACFNRHVQALGQGLADYLAQDRIKDQNSYTLKNPAELQGKGAAMRQLSRLYEKPDSQSPPWNFETTTLYVASLAQQKAYEDYFLQDVRSVLKNPKNSNVHQGLAEISTKHRLVEAATQLYQMPVMSPNPTPPPPWSLQKGWNTAHPEAPVMRVIIGVGGVPKPEETRTGTQEVQAALDDFKAAFGFHPSDQPYFKPFLADQNGTFGVLKAAFTGENQLLRQTLLDFFKNHPNGTLDLVFLYSGHGHAEGGNALQGSQQGVLDVKAGETLKESELKQLMHLLETDPDFQPYAARFYRSILLNACHSGAFVTGTYEMQHLPSANIS